MTHWFEAPATGPVRLRLSGRRLGLAGRPGPRDRFEYEERIEVLAESGPIAVTSRIDKVNPDAWDVDAHLVGEKTPVRRAGW